MPRIRLRSVEWGNPLVGEGGDRNRGSPQGLEIPDWNLKFPVSWVGSLSMKPAGKTGETTKLKEEGRRRKPAGVGLTLLSGAVSLAP